MCHCELNRPDPSQDGARHIQSFVGIADGGEANSDEAISHPLPAPTQSQCGQFICRGAVSAPNPVAPTRHKLEARWHERGIQKQNVKCQAPSPKLPKNLPGTQNEMCHCELNRPDPSQDGARHIQSFVGIADGGDALHLHRANADSSFVGARPNHLRLQT